MHRVLSLSTCALLVLAAAACGATHADAHPTTRHASAPPPPADSPLWVADQYYVASAFPDEAAHVTGDFARRFAGQPTLGSLLAPRVRVAVRPLLVHGDSAVVAATITDSANARVSEWYSYLVRDGGTWKMYAVRTVEFSPTFHARVDSAGAAHAPTGTVGRAASTMLAVGSDSALRAFVASNVAPLDSLVAAYRAVPGAPAMVDVGDATAVAAREDGQTAADPSAPVHHLLARTGVSTVYRNPVNPACTFVRIGGEGRRQVGAIRADAGCRLPPMNPAGLVYTEHVQGDWYVYRAL